MSKTQADLALVTGASSGIGKAIAIRLAQDGFSVLVHYNSNREGAEATLQEVKKHAEQSEIIQFDIADSDQVERALKNFDIGVLINNAGMHMDGMALIMPNEQFERVVKTNLMGPFYVTKVCAKNMLLHRKGCIVNISSIAGQTGNAGQVNFSAAKAGLISMTKTLC
ncbi:MAG: SDR family oxidoreductase, partial [Pseudobdellovibrionaceae bacterium]